MPHLSRSRKLAYLALITNAFIWGAAFPLIKPAFHYLTSIQYLYFRFLVAGFFALPIFFWYYLTNKPKTSYLIKVTCIELLGVALPLLFLYEGLYKTSALEASLLASTTPLFVVIGGIFFLHEKETRREWQGLALSLLGSILIVLDPIFNGQKIVGSSLDGNLLIMGYNLTYTTYVIIAKKIYQHKPPLFNGALTYLGTTIIYGFILNTRHALPSLDLLANPQVLLPVLYMAIPGGILAFALQLYAIGKIEVSEANLFTYLNGVVAIPVSALVLSEYPTPLTLLAILIICFGVLRAQTKSRTIKH